MTDSLTLRVRALELAKKPAAPAAISQTISGRSLAGGSSTAIDLTAVPIGKLVSFSISLPYRFPAGAGLFTNTQLFDGTTQVSNDVIMGSSTSGGAQILSATLTIGGYTFATMATIKIYAGSSAAITLDTTKMMGMAWS